MLFKFGLIENESLFLDMLEDRNKTFHIYNKEESESIFNKIKDKYVAAIERLVKNISDYKPPEIPEKNL